MLRRRLAKDKDDVPSGPENNNDDTPPADSSPPSRPPPPEKYGSFVTKPHSKRRNGLIFVLGGILGILVAVLFANQQDVISLESLMDLNLDSLMDVIPQGIVSDAREFSVCSTPLIACCVIIILRDCPTNVSSPPTSNMNATRSVMIRSPWDSIFNRKASRPNTPSS